MHTWHRISSDDPDLFERLRACPGARICVRFHAGVEDAFHTEIPASSFALRGALRVEEEADRFSIQVPGWGPEDFAWFARRRRAGGADYWQCAVEYRPGGTAGLVLYFTAPLDGLEISVQGAG
jgi:hypothetical protein